MQLNKYLNSTSASVQTFKFENAVKLDNFCVCGFHIYICIERNVFWPSWICPKTWSLGCIRLWTVFSSSTHPTRCIFLGTQSRKPCEKKKESFTRRQGICKAVLLYSISEISWFVAFHKQPLKNGHGNNSVCLGKCKKEGKILEENHKSSSEEKGLW